MKKKEETQRRKWHREPAALEICSTHVIRGPGKFMGQCCPGSAHQLARSLPEGGTRWHDVRQNARYAKAGCLYKIPGILGQTVSMTCLQALPTYLAVQKRDESLSVVCVFGSLLECTS